MQIDGVVAELAKHGLGAALAGLMFYVYRQDRKASEDSLKVLGAEFREIVEANTAALTRLCTLLDRSQPESRRPAGRRAEQS